MRTRPLSSPPNLLPLYVRAAAALLPGASRLPFVPGADTALPDLELTLPAVHAQSVHLAAYARVCGFARGGESLPLTYPHVLAFPLQMALMADGRFPFGPVGLVHVENRITQHRAIGAHERLELRVRAGALAPHARGRTFALITEALVDDELVWEERSTMLHRGDPSSPVAAATATALPALERTDTWHLPDDLGRKYASVSGDRNPIHVHPLPAKAFGFARAIAHGMWSKARCVAALDPDPAAPVTVQVRYRKPILLPATVEFLRATDGDGTVFAPQDESGETLHLDGLLTPNSEESE
jgi:acyl dehydratase